MTPTSRVIQDEIDNLLSYLIDSEIALHVNLVGNDGGRISWRPWEVGKFLENREFQSLDDYVRWVEAGEYSALLFDGALLQFTYEFSGRQLASHRLAWIPCPFRVDPDLLQTEPVIDVIELYAAGRPADVVLQTSIRFDFDHTRAGPGHPASHLSINSAECRVACAAPLRLGHFFEFVFRHFYPDIWRLHPYFSGLSRRGWGSHTVTPEERAFLHVSWLGDEGGGDLLAS